MFKTDTKKLYVKHKLNIVALRYTVPNNNFLLTVLYYIPQLILEYSFHQDIKNCRMYVHQIY